jgi:hypothetical protein
MAAGESNSAGLWWVVSSCPSPTATDIAVDGRIGLDGKKRRMPVRKSQANQSSRDYHADVETLRKINGHVTRDADVENIEEIN